MEFKELNKQGLQNSMGFPAGSDSKESTGNVGGPGSMLGSRRSLGERSGIPFEYSCLENSMDIGDWRATVHGVQRVKHN